MVETPIEIQETPSFPSTDDPQEFLSRFKGSKWYKDAFAGYYNGKNLSTDVTEEEKEKAFLESDVAKFALIDFASNDLSFKYNPEKYSPESRKSLQEYIDTVEDITKMIREGATQHEIVTLDGMRFLNHIAAAKQLAKDGIIPTEKVGRVIARLVLVDKGLDTIDSTREPDVKRIERRIGGD